MLDTAWVPAWTAWVLNALHAHPELTIALVINAPSGCRGRSLVGAYEAVDRRLFPVESDALASVDASAPLAGIPCASPDEVAPQSLDVILHLAGERPCGAVLAAPRHGVWSFRLGAGSPPLFWELHDGAPHAETALELLCEDGATPIYCSVGSTDAVSLHRSRSPACWKTARFAIRRLEDLASGRWPPEPHANGGPQRTGPSAALTVRHVARVAGRVARRKAHLAAYQHQWFLGIRRRDGDRLPHEDPAPWRTVVPPPDRSFADPFVVSHGGETYVFLEVLPHDTGIGELAVGRISDHGELTDVTPILPVPHHTSYPYVFADGGRMFLIPESADARRVDLLAATDFPTGWERVATLLDDVNAVDATVVAHDGRYWMWVAIGVPGGRVHDETFLYFSDRLDGGWTPHPRNPVVSDVRRARSAGRPFVHRGRLIRPSQDCAGRYGKRVVFNVVERLTPDDYAERPDGELGPGWAATANLAAHTYTFDGEWEATDGLRTFARLTRGRP